MTTNIGSGSKRRSKLKSTRHWHRYLGLIAIIFALMLAITGMMLNHTETLNLDSRFVKSRLLLRWYGIGSPAPPISYSLGSLWFSQIGKQIFMNNSRLQNTDSSLLGVVKLNDFLVMAFHNQLTLITLDGKVIEYLKNEAGIPKEIQKIGIDKDERLVLGTPNGDYSTDEEMLIWHSFKSSEVTWSESASMPSEIEGKLMTVYQGEGLPLERVILDLHSGRIFGSWGVYCFDAIAIVIILLSLTGAYIFFFPAGLRKRKPKLQKYQ